MYYQFFGFHQPPFSIVPNPYFLLLTPQHRDALAHLTFSAHTDGIVVLVGEAGTGKTTIVRTFLEQKSTQVNTALIIHPQLSAVELLQTICSEFGITTTKDIQFKELLDCIWQYLLKQHSAGRRCVLIIDEAHNLSADVMETVRMLTNLETVDKKLLQIILVGQPELITLLDQPQLRQIKQRITATFALQPITNQNLQEYIYHRLQLSGCSQNLFDNAVCKVIARHAQGIPRTVNIICDRILLAAYAQHQKNITVQLAKTTIAELATSHNLVHKKNYRFALLNDNKLLWYALIVLLFAGVGSGYVFYSVYQQFIQLQNSLPIQTTNLYADRNYTSKNADSNLASSNQEDLLVATHDNKDSVMTNEKYLFASWQQPNGSCSGASALKMDCVTYELDWSTFLQLNTPAIVRYADHMVVLLSVTDTQAQVWRAGELLSVSVADMAKYWPQSVRYIMPVPVGFTKSILANSYGFYMRWLLGALLQFYQQMPNHQVTVNVLNDRLSTNNYRMDAMARSWVKQFQAISGLQVDGVFGVASYLYLQQAIHPNFLSLRTVE